MIMSFDMWRHSLPCIEIIRRNRFNDKSPDPNGFGGPVRVCQERGEWEDQALAFPNNARNDWGD